MFLLSALLALSCRTVSSARPNVVFIIADDMGWSDVGFTGGDVNTPNLDALAYNSVVLKRHYSQPLCTPSRGALLTGDYPIRHGLQGKPCYPGVADGLPLGVKLLPEYFRDLGYKTHLIGKWHLGYETWDHMPTRRGFDTFFGYLSGYLSYWDGVHFYDGRGGRDFWRNETGAWAEAYGHYLTELLTKEALKIIEEHEPSQSMLLFLNHNAVHTTPLGIEKDAPETVTNSTSRGIFREMVRWLDWSVGEVVSGLERKGLLNNTIVVFISDNGAPSRDSGFNNFGSNWPFKGQKASVHEGGVRTPGLIYSEMIDSKPRVSEHIFHITDWLPTLYAAVGGDGKDLKHKDGLDQWSSLMTGSEGPRQELLVNINEVQDIEAYVSGRWKLIKNGNPEGGWSMDDLYTGVSPDWMAYSGGEVAESVAARALGGLPSDWEEELKSAVLVRGTCEDREASEARDCHSDYCLFDLLSDPTECSDLAKDNPSLVTQLKSRIDFYRDFLRPQTPKILNQRAFPAYHGDYWAPWL